jgi:hypothetical protein
MHEAKGGLTKIQDGNKTSVITKSEKVVLRVPVSEIREEIL